MLLLPIINETITWEGHIMSDLYAIVSHQDDDGREMSQNERTEVKKDEPVYILSSHPVCITKHTPSKEACPWRETKLQRTENLFESKGCFGLGFTSAETEFRDVETLSFRAEHRTFIRECSQCF